MYIDGPPQQRTEGWSRHGPTAKLPVTLPSEAATQAEPKQVTKSDLAFPVVGIGASAGGVAALTRFFERMDEPCGMAFVVILHLSPNHESNVAAILQRVTKLEVVQVTGRMAIHPDRVYVIPPSKNLNMDDNHVELVEPTRDGGPHVAVDLFLRTLAEVHAERAFAVVLSGMGTDGALGVRRINECGGVTIAQEPSDAEFDSMPRAAIATGVVDLVLPVDQMPKCLEMLWRNLREMRLPRLTETANPAFGIEQDERFASERALRETLTLLHKRTRHDFRHYKRATVLRRLARRLQVNAVPDLAAYRDYLDQHPAETGALLQDMLISVTNFFRDADAFATLESTIVPALLANRSGADSIRVWVPACATGEEAYSLAILLREQAEKMANPPKVQVFATDIDERAIAIARSGLYPQGIAKDVRPDRLRRFFRQEGDRYRVVKVLRESVLFAVHNVLRDPPFSRLDLVSCRNLLIYLDLDAQRTTLEVFRFALRADGCLFLGPSESTDSVGNAFHTIDKQHRIFGVDADVVAERRDMPPPSPSTAFARAEEDIPQPDQKPMSDVDRHRWALESFALPSVLIDGRRQLIHMSASATAFFMRAGGTPSHGLIANTIPEIRSEMNTVVYRAQQTRKPASIRAAWHLADGTRRRVSIDVHPFSEPDSDADMCLVTLQSLPDDPTLSDNAPDAVVDREVVRELESEVLRLKADLQDTIERSDTSNEALKASNEELQAVNEELRSASEELETGKEELQSINEELTTVNAELKAKVDETTQINDDLQNLITSTDIAVVFVDSHMRVKRFTPRATDLFNLIPGDVGRSLLDITHQLEWASLAHDAEQAFRSLRTVERETQGANGRHYLARVNPYRTTDNRIEGAVMTFVDITSRVIAEHRVDDNEERLRIAAETVRHYIIITLDATGAIRTWNAGARDAFGYGEVEVLGQSFAMLFTPEDRAHRMPERELDVARATGSAEDERWHLRKDGTRFYCSGVTTSYQSRGQTGFAKMARDMTGTKLLEARRDEELSQQKQAGLAAEAANRLKDEFLAVMSHELKHPLNLIHVNAELLTRMPEVAQLPAVKRSADTIRRTVASQARIIDDLLDLSRARTGKMMMTLVRSSLCDIVSRIVDAAGGDAEQKRIELVRRIDADDALMVLCDAVRVEQIVWNLLSNAIKFTDPGGKVSVALTRVAGEAVLEVTDTGRGISPSFLSNVFSMFRQEHRETTGAEAGMGIGLALVKELTEAQGGRVAVRSGGIGKGATFLIAMPTNDEQATVPETTTDEPEGPLVGLRILAIDDSAEALEPFAELLRIEGADVVEGHSGAEALEWLDRQTFDVLISDVGMPKMDGYQLIDQIRRRNDNERLVAIAMSGYGRAGDVQRATTVGFDAHLTKPASIDDCKAVIVKLMQRGRLRRG